MIMSTIWFIKVFLSHLITDFILQPKAWVAERNARHFSSPKLYWHGLITAIFAWIMAGWQYWLIAIIILITHTVIDGWKSYKAQTVNWFLIDQLLHILVITGCWFFIFFQWNEISAVWQKMNVQKDTWKLITGFVFVTIPAGILIGQFTKEWRDKIPDAENLANAGKWIGIIERIIILVFVLQNQYSAIGLLIAAKGIIRFNDKDRQEIKTEYLVIGTLISIAIAIITGLIIKA
jgi:hypothetical protein